MNPPLFDVEWKGRNLGSFSLPDIRARLESGEFSRMHRVQVQGVWQTLGGWLDQIEASSRQAEEAAQAQVHSELSAERARAAALEKRLQQQENQPRFVPPAVPSHMQPPGSFLPNYDAGRRAAVESPTCGFAVAALVFGILSVLFLTTCYILTSEQIVRWVGITAWCAMVSWLFAIIFGNLALVQIRGDESLRGGGLAMAGLILGYGVVLFITVMLFLGSSGLAFMHGAGFR